MRPHPPVDASMGLLNQILRQPYDPDYAVVAARSPQPARFRLGLTVVLLLIGAMFAVSTLQTTRTAPAAQRERAELIERVQTAQARQNQLRTDAAALTAQIATLRRTALGGDDDAVATRTRLDSLSLATGATPVSGPGLQIVLDDAPERAVEQASDGGVDGAVDNASTVTAQDVQVLVNSLWGSGAEAVAINGHRLSTLTAVRQAGSALTVDYSSITHPYTVEAIGDPRTFAAAYAQSDGSAWWETLRSAQQMRYDVGSADALTLAAEPGLTLRFARRPTVETPASEGPR